MYGRARRSDDGIACTPRLKFSEKNAATKSAIGLFARLGYEFRLDSHRVKISRLFSPWKGRESERAGKMKRARGEHLRMCETIAKALPARIDLGQLLRKRRKGSGGEELLSG